MGKHILSLRIPDVANEGVFVIEDTSIYDSILPISCMDLQIIPPGYVSPTILTLTIQGWRLVLNACTLGIALSGGCSDGCPNISDGIYNINYSVSPNDKVYVQYNYLRTTTAFIRLNYMRCQLNLQCCPPDKESIYILDQFNLIESFLKSAKANVENSSYGSIEDGLNQYHYGIQLMNKLSTRKPLCYGL